ncbi:MAG: uracil-DNA glycosylase [Candidatus Dadabacteria bacterium]|nr:MAG: uracil-DNA glycosylase [Candidatus Dadabacteria bacterium]
MSTPLTIDQFLRGEKPPSEWRDVLGPEKEKPYFKKILSFLEEEEKKGKTIYPPKHLRFNALKLTPFKKVKVVILGQDPYHGPGQAHGLCFSVPKGVPLPPSLQNIFKELKADLGVPYPSHGCLESWAKQGVLLLNAILSVERGKPASHRGIGWEQFTDAVIRVINDYKKNVVFLLWGADAQRKGAFIDRERHLVLEAPHPSPFSANRGFFGCRHFSKANAYLEKIGKEPINWSLQ